MPAARISSWHSIALSALRKVLRRCENATGTYFCRCTPGYFRGEGGCERENGCADHAIIAVNETYRKFT